MYWQNWKIKNWNEKEWKLESQFCILTYFLSLKLKSRQILKIVLINLRLKLYFNTKRSQHPTTHLLISNHITSHYCVVRLLINAFQADQPPIHLCCHLCIMYAKCNLNAMFVSSLSFFLFSWFLYKSINNKRNFFSSFSFYYWNMFLYTCWCTICTHNVLVFNTWHSLNMFWKYYYQIWSVMLLLLTKWNSLGTY